MIKAFAPRDSGGCSWVLLSIVLLAGSPVVVRSQTPKPAMDAFGPVEDPAPKADGDAEKKPVEPPTAAEGAEKPTSQIETFRDERAEKLLPNTFPTLGKPTRSQDIAAVKAMASGAANVDRATIERFVNH